MSVREKIASQNGLDDFYTPSNTASVLAGWAIRTGDEKVLEPSAGAGSLIISCLRKASLLKNDARCNFLAFDIDIRAIEQLKKIDSSLVSVWKGNFLDTIPDDYGQVDVVVANPPFRRNHKIEKGERAELKKKYKTRGAIGIWGHFFLHSLRFLKEGGRVACIVPRTVLFTDHGHCFMSRVCALFSNVGIYEFVDRPKWSKQADEAGAVIFADGYKDGVSETYLRGFVDEEGDLEVESFEDSFPYKEMQKSSTVLGSISEISIGSVTGRNKVFLLSEEEAVDAGIGNNDLLPIVSRAKHLSGIVLGELELSNLGARGEKTWLLYPEELSGEAKKYLSERISEEDIVKTAWFRKRTPWWKVQVGKPCDSLITYMNYNFPRLVFLEDEIYCTNTLHRVVYNANADGFLIKSSLITPVSTFGQLWSEKNGRSYGGGMLKLELSEARMMPVIDKKYHIDDEVLLKVDRLIRAGDDETARQHVDAIIMPEIFGPEWRSAQKELEEELVALRTARKGGA
ncbi:N-6 DNA methylase [Halomonas elongata]|uniref:Eco57I restriction-modification methylase domain-containing protein n=1 Tax=Halomonas elongata TaxID=2746 RepID=UPI0033484C11